MLASEQVDELICLVASLDRAALIGQFHAYRASFPLDFTDEFLRTIPVDRLRHVFVALCLEQQHLPDALAPSAAWSPIPSGPSPDHRAA